MRCSRLERRFYAQAAGVSNLTAQSRVSAAAIVYGGADWRIVFGLIHNHAGTNGPGRERLQGEKNKAAR